MFFQYETPRLLLKVLRADCAPQVLDFTIGIKSFSKCMK